jgi:anti-sigma factor RsiW
MECNEFEQRISRLRDGELPQEESAEVFRHLAECGECRSFFHQLQALDRALNDVAVAVPDATAVRASAFPVAVPSRRLWERRVALRLPVAAILLCVIIAGVVALLPGSNLFHEPQAIYVTKLPTVVVEATPPSSRQ